MAFRVQEFRSQLTGDGARPNLFRVSMNFPILALSSTPESGFSSASGAPQKLTFMCRAAQIPGDSVNPVPVNYFGREVKVAGNRMFQDWTLTIINDEDFIVRRALEKWMSGINSHAGNLRASQFAQGDGGYQQDAKVLQYAKTGEVIKAYNFIGAFPTDLSPIELDWAANDSIEEYAATFTYQWWESDTTDFTTNVLPVEP